MSEEIEVKVRQIANDDNATSSSDAKPIIDLMRRLLLASIGAIALTYDEAERLINRLVERGELAHKDGEKILNELVGNIGKGGAPTLEQQVTTIGTQIESGLEHVFNNLNIPSKRDIDDLSDKIAQLASRVEELRQNKS